MEKEDNKKALIKKCIEIKTFKPLTCFEPDDVMLNVLDLVSSSDLTEKNLLDFLNFAIYHNYNINYADIDNYSLVSYSALYGYLNLLTFLIKNNSNLNIIDKEEKCTPLHMAIYNENIKVAKLLIKYGVDLTLKDKDGLTPLDASIKDGHKDIVILLVLKGARK